MARKEACKGMLKRHSERNAALTLASVHPMMLARAIMFRIDALVGDSGRWYGGLFSAKTFVFAGAVGRS